MNNSRVLWAVLAVLLLAVAVVYGYRWLSRGEAKKNPVELAAKALADVPPQQRQIAAVKLVECGPPAREEIRRVLRESKQPEVRAACIQGMNEQYDYQSMRTLLDLLDDPSPAVRLQAGEAVQHMLLRDFGFREVNGEGQEAQRQALVAQMRAEWDAFKKRKLYQAFIREKMGKSKDEDLGLE